MNKRDNFLVEKVSRPLFITIQSAYEVHTPYINLILKKIIIQYSLSHLGPVLFRTILTFIYGQKQARDLLQNMFFCFPQETTSWNITTFSLLDHFF